VNKNEVYALALGRIKGLGSKTIASLLKALGSYEAICTARYSDLCRIAGVGPVVAQSIASFKSYDLCEKEMEFIARKGIELLFPNDDEYPSFLKHIPDFPYLLFKKGPLELANQKMLAVVGTRHASRRAERIISEIFEGIQDQNCVIVSGLAYGIDAMAHRQALKYGLPTIAVLAHGFDRVYPVVHHKLVRQILEAGGALLTEYQSGTIPNRENFPMRNRIVAGMSEGVLVVESKGSGGSLITADLAFHYNREVMAIPGRITDLENEGCLDLIRTNKAHLISKAEHIVETLNWEFRNSQSKQLQIALDLNPDQEEIWNALKDNSPLHIDKLKLISQRESGDLAMILFELEMMGLVQVLPGQVYEINA